jgi:hypothetical protein
MNPKFNFDRAEDLVGRSILIDLTVRDHDELFIEKKKMFGWIVDANQDQGIAVKLEPSGEIYHLVPDLDQLEVPPPGEYRLEPGDEIALNPELRAAHVVHLPPPEFEGPVH